MYTCSDRVYVPRTLRSWDPEILGSIASSPMLLGPHVPKALLCFHTKTLLICNSKNNPGKTGPWDLGVLGT